MMKLVKLEFVSERDIIEYLIGLAESLTDYSITLSWPPHDAQNFT